MIQETGMGGAFTASEDLWERCGIPKGIQIDETLPAVLAEIKRRYGAPRGDMELLSAFIRDVLPPGRYLIYGAGEHTRALLPLLIHRTDIEVRGLLDRLAPAIGSFEGLPVYPPRDVAGLTADWILISHGSYESEMIETLLASGVAPARIIPIYTNPVFRDLCRGFFQERILSRLPGGVDFLVVTCSHLSLASARQIGRLFPADRTLYVHLGRPDSAGMPTEHQTIDLRESLDALAALVERVRPRTIYLSTIIYKNFLGLYLKALYPEIVLIHEIYDYALCWLDRDLEALFGLSSWTTRLLRFSEYVSGQRADLVISKRGGAEWDAVWNRCAAPYRLLFPLLDKVANEPTGEEPARDFVYAGFLPSRNFLKTFTNGYAFLPMLSAVCAEGGMTADIFNAAHAPGTGDPIFREHIDDYAEGPVRYHPRLPYAELIHRLSGYAYGWLWDPQTDPHPDRAVGVCNRWTGYLSGGLPVVLDPEWRFMADLVREHRAGIVVAGRTPEDLIRAIRAHDRRELARGVGTLLDKLLRWNDETLDVAAATSAPLAE